MSHSDSVIGKVLEALKQGEELTQLEATSRWGITRLASAVHVLRKKGYAIITIDRLAANGSRYAEYRFDRT
ncbi:helix-turn-helix domain-containing protein [Sulfitobacter geojensis]|uniref:Winged helix-turn-helix domain-containing protein n=1 Tax=Sulfitobacter geojensis TaxID=1342299 RepID=A0AAE2W1N5_9RHOB|nr:helix-turn-helix domain-containing protein [Sulfitobacter geojensis]MBM1690685.1 hypothetical protein [Sulfitobacter geojensis]MBM1694751.1 hypothetical protein [Sulfitobacter geojensis]MBM1707543.1 hypothetical protein [Sulfitobacter geojensis]MBM1711153.1 hypothetical protein [Sulfitobacter geojensis]MBM1715668.1 hypothetical protein [Sulfitobacter geojensis]